eukprot:XP_008646852.1 homeotic protein knotted-1-like [Zea mays]
MGGSWLWKHVRMYSITARQNLSPSASRRAPRVWSRRRRWSAAKSSIGIASEINVGSSDTGMGLIPSGTSVRLVGPCSNALDPGTMLCLEIFKCLLRRLHRLGPQCRLRHLEPSSSSPYGGDIEAIKAKIISHPHYYSLLTIYLECNKVGAPPEVSARLTEIAQEVEARQRTTLGGLAAAAEPELDQFMEAYHEMLVKFREKLMRPLREAMEFMRRVESQLNSLSISGRSLRNILSSEH